MSNPTPAQMNCGRCLYGPPALCTCGTCPPDEDEEDHINDALDGEESDDFEDDCGLMRNGQCSQAGTEYCDFGCPNRESELFCGSAAWRQKHGED